MSARLISSAQTFINKFIAPLFLAAVLTFWLALRGNSFLPLFLLLGVVWGWSVYWGCAPLKRVALNQEGLLISNYLREVRVPWQNIIQVSGSRWANQVTVTFDCDFGFGNSIVFMPKTDLLYIFREHPIAQNCAT